MKTKLEVILDTALFFHRHPNKRAVVKNVCKYLTKDGRRCAVGRYIKEEEDAEFLRLTGALSILKDEYAHLKDEVDFWCELQILHDDRDHWSSEGLTKKGHDYLIGLLVRHCGLSDTHDEGQKSKLEIALETALYYHQDTSRRGALPSGGCCYVTYDGKRCAVGRCSEVTSETSFRNVIDNLKPEYKGHSDSFWASLQAVHDPRDFWDEDGLRLSGLNRLMDLLNWHCVKS